MYAQPKALIFLGPPGSGKGTQAARLSAALEIPAISTGDILRRECQSGSRLGRKVDTTLRSGGLVDDNLMNQIVENRLAHKDCKGGCILDGFPRTVEQARHLDSVLRHVGMRKPIVFDFAVSAEALIERLARRRQCPTCGRIYSSDPDNSGPVVVCRNDGAKLVTRADDRPAVVEERFRIYEENARHLFLFYQRVELHRIKAGQPVDDVTDQLLHALGLSGVGRRVGTPSKLAVATC